MCSRPVRNASSAASCSAAPMWRRTSGPCVATSKPATVARPADGRQQRREHVHGRRLARAVGAEEAVDLARADLEVDAVDGLDAALELAHEALGADALLGAHGADRSKDS